MKALHSFSRRSGSGRLLALAVGGLLLPAAILFVLQYRSLAQLQAQTEGATRETLRKSLAVISMGMQRSFENYSD